MTRDTPSTYETREEINRIFNKFDKNQKGYITIDDLRKVCADLGEDMEEDSL